MAEDVDVDRGITSVIGLRTAVTVEVAEGLDLEGRRRRIVRTLGVVVEVVLEDVTSDVLLAFVSVRHQVVGRFSDVVSRVDRDGQARAFAVFADGVARDVAQDDRAVPVVGGREVVGTVGRNGDFACLVEARGAILASSVDRNWRAREGREHQLDAVDIEVVELLNRHRGPRSIENRGRVDVGIVGQEVARNRVILGDRVGFIGGGRLVAHLGDREGQRSRIRPAFRITHAVFEVKGAVEVSRTREGVLAGKGVDGEVTGLNAGGLVDFDRGREVLGGHRCTRSIDIGQLLDRQGRGRDVQRSAGVRVDAVGQQVSSDVAGFEARAAVVGCSRRLVIHLSELNREIGRDRDGTDCGVLDRVGHGHVAVVVIRSVKGVSAVFRHRQGTSLDEGNVIVAEDVDIDCGITGRIGQSVTVAIDVTEGLDLQGRL